jgi:hypothetical protein
VSDVLLLVHEDEAAHAAQSPAAIAELIARRARFTAALRARGQLRDHGRFRPSREGVRVHRDRVEHGPFARPLAAYCWVDDAAHLVEPYPALAGDELAVRPLMKGIPMPDKDRKPGKIFGFVVIGEAAVMDLIDAETHASFPADAFAGGNRLHAPRRATLDGPFLESKEIIGGVFFLRMASIEDAVRWAAASRFVVHGALEIRELWRS